MHNDTHEVDNHRVAQEEREAEQDPRQIRSLEVQKTEEVHSDVRIPSTPDVNEHNRKRVTKKHHVNKHRNNLRPGVKEKQQQLTASSITKATAAQSMSVSQISTKYSENSGNTQEETEIHTKHHVNIGEIKVENSKTDNG